MAELIDGHVSARFEAVHAAFEQNLASGAELGASVCVIQGDEVVVDLWGGHADATRQHPWTRDTLVNVYSCTKPMTALVVLWACDQGLLDLDAPVCAYWPEFAANGKENVLVRHVMSHSSGLAEWAEPIDVAGLYDWPLATGRLAAQATAWEPGTASGYHSLTQGYLLGEILRRVSGRTVGRIFRDEFALPLAADFHIGLPATEDQRVAELVIDPRWVDREESLVMKTGPLDVSLPGTAQWRRAEIPAAGGIGNARSVCAVQSLLANRGEAAGRRILSTRICERVFEPQVEGTDRILDMQLTFGMGYALGAGLMPNPNTAYWGGYGGSLVIVDMDAQTTFAYAMNQMAPPGVGDSRGFDLALAMWSAMGLV